MQMWLDIFQHRPQATGVIEILHQVGIAVGSDISYHWHVAADAVKIGERNI